MFAFVWLRHSYLWGSDPAPLLQLNNGKQFDVLVLCDLNFNFSQHDALLETVQACMKDDGTVRLCPLYVLFLLLLMCAFIAGVGNFL